MSVPLFTAVVAQNHRCLALDATKDMSQYVHTAWDTDDGLPQLSVYGIAQSRDGYLWIGTQEGLARFDGIRFVVFDTGNVAGITSNWFSALCRDREAGIWAATLGPELVHIGKGEPQVFSVADKLPRCRVWGITQDQDGVLWLATDAGLTRFDAGRTVLPDAEGKREPAGSVGIGTGGALWVGTRGAGLKRIDRLKGTTLHRYEEFLGRDILAVFEDSTRALWVSTAGRGVHRLLNDGSRTVYTTADGLPSNIVWAITEDRDGNVWLGTDAGCVRYRDGHFSCFSTSNGLTHNSVRSLYVDAEGNLWIGTSRGGLNRLKDGEFRAFGTAEGLSHDIALPVCQDRRGVVWVGTAGGGLSFRAGQRGFAPYGGVPELSDDYVRALWPASDGGLWIGTRNEGLKYLRDDTIKTFGVNDGLPSASVRAVYEDTKGRVWVSAGSALAKLEDGRFRAYHMQDTVPSEVSVIYEAQNGRLWLGTIASGLHVMEENGRIVPHADSRGRNLVGRRIYSIHEDSKGTLWIGTDAGLWRFRDDTLRVYSRHQGLYDNIVMCVLDDQVGNLWMSCNKGIFRVSKTDLESDDREGSGTLDCVSYGKSDGMRIAECEGGIQPSGWRDAEGRLWFPTSRGVVMTNPRRPRSTSFPLHVFVEQLVVDDTPVTLTEEVVIGPGPSRLQFHYTAPALWAPEKVNFEYWLEGFDQGWVRAGTRRIAYYGNIPPGRYTFKVKASNGGVIGSRDPAQLRLRVRPAFHQTPFFYALCIACAVALLLWGHHTRTEQLRTKAAVVEERYRLARELHDTLVQDLTGIVIALNAVEGVAGPAREKAEDLIRRALSLGRGSLSALRRAVWDMRATEINGAGLVEAIRSMAIRKVEDSLVRVEVNAHGDSRPLPSHVMSHLIRVAQEALVNAMRHSGANHVWIGIVFERRRVTLAIRDDGHGFDGGKATTGLEGGFGLVEMHERVESLGGKVIIRTSPGGGTEVIVDVPIR